MKKTIVSCPLSFAHRIERVRALGTVVVGKVHAQLAVVTARHSLGLGVVQQPHLALLEVRANLLGHLLVKATAQVVSEKREKKKETSKSIHNDSLNDARKLYLHPLDLHQLHLSTLIITTINYFT